MPKATQYLEISKQKLEKAKLPTITKEISQEVRKIEKAGKKLQKANTPEEKRKIMDYIDTVKTKLDMTLNAMTKEKFDAATLAQLAKAARVLSGEITSARGSGIQRVEEKKMAVNINIDGMKPKELIEFLSKKSQEKD